MRATTCLPCKLLSKLTRIYATPRLGPFHTCLRWLVCPILALQYEKQRQCETVVLPCCKAALARSDDDYTLCRKRSPVCLRTSTIMPFVQFPLLIDRDPHESSLFQDVPERTDSTLEKRSVGHVGDQSCLLDKLTRLNDFFVSFGRQGTIIPSRELQSITIETKE